MGLKYITAEKMSYNKITLSFDETVEALFRKKYFKDSIIQVRIALALVVVLYGVFGFLDVLLFPEYSSYLLKIRFFYVIPFALIVLLISFTKIFSRIWQGLLFACFIIGGTGISLMTMIEPENNLYYSGLMLIFFSGYLFMKIRFFWASLAGWITLVIFNLLALFVGNASSIVIISTNFFFVSANLIGMFAAYYVEFQVRRNFFLAQKIDEEKVFIEDLNKNLEKTVDERTEELVTAKNIAEETKANVTAIIEGTTESIWALDLDYKILYINKIFQKEFFEAFGVFMEPGLSLISSLPESLQPFWKARYDRVLANEHYIVEDAVDTDNGKVYIQVNFNPIVKQGKVVGGSCFGNNITYRKLAELEIVKAKERAEESDRLKSAFLANMSHEIRTPMNGILGFSELLKEPNLTGEEQKQYIDIIEKSGNRMLNIINDIVDISKIEAGLMDVNIDNVNVNDLIKYIYSFFKPEAENKGLEFFIRDVDVTNTITINTDREKLYAVLTNLVKNAIKYTDEGSVEFGYIKQNDNLEFFIKDTGVGIPKDRQEAIFERFIQADITNEMAQQGTGLGLSISKAFTTMLNGNIWVDSQEGVGSTFYFTLPLNSRMN